MGKWIFALAGIVACVIGGFAANQGRVDLVKVSKAALDAPKVFEEGKKAGLLLDFDEVNKEFPIPPDDQNFAMVVPDVIRLGKLETGTIRRFVSIKPTPEELAKLEAMTAGLDFAVKESKRTGFRLDKDYRKYGAYESIFTVVNICNALTNRGLVKGNNGDFDGCLMDLNAALRIGRLMSLESTSTAWRNAESVISNVSEAAILLASTTYAKDAAKLDRLKAELLTADISFDVNRYIRLSCYATMNNARNKVAYVDEAPAHPQKFVEKGIAPDARGRFEQYKGLKMFMMIRSAWKDCGHDLVKFEQVLRTMDVGIENGRQSPNEFFFTISPALTAMTEHRRALANIEATRMSLKLGRWPTLSEINGPFMTNPRTGQKFEISYAGKAPEFIKHEILTEDIK